MGPTTVWVGMLALTSIAANAPAAAQQTPTMLRTRVIPTTIIANSPAQLLCTVLLPMDTTSARLVIWTPDDVVASSPLGERVRVGKGAVQTDQALLVGIRPSSSPTTYTLALAAQPGAHSRGDRLVIVDLVVGPVQTGRVLQSQEVSITLRPQLGIWQYIFFGALGIAVGYLIRQVMRSTSTVPAPLLGTPPPPMSGSQAPPETSPRKGWLTKLIEQQPAAYFAVDGGVTLLLGLAAMLALIKDGQLPDAGTTWYATVLLGAALGLLANSELVTKLK